MTRRLVLCLLLTSLSMALSFPQKIPLISISSCSSTSASSSSSSSSVEVSNNNNNNNNNNELNTISNYAKKTAVAILFSSILHPCPQPALAVDRFMNDRKYNEIVQDAKELDTQQKGVFQENAMETVPNRFVSPPNKKKHLHPPSLPNYLHYLPHSSTISLISLNPFYRHYQTHQGDNV